MSNHLSFQKLLVAVDFSPASCAAIQQAVWVAKKTGATLTLVHVLPNIRKSMHSASIDAKLDLLYGEGSVFHREVLSAAELRLQQLADKVAHPDLVVKHKVLLGEPLAEICRLTQVGEYDLVLAGAHAMTVWQELFVGSTAKKLIHTCPAPVWIVRPEHVGQPAAILTATDFSPVCRRAIDVASSLSQVAKVPLHMLHVVDSMDVPEDILSKVPEGKSLRDEINQAAKKRFDEFVATLGAQGDIRPHLTWGTPWKEINRVANQLQIDLLVVGSIGRSGIAGMLMGNTAERLLACCRSSLLTVKPANFLCPIPLGETVTEITSQAAFIE
ncbi:Universal stress protein E [Anatilimnocola aggregata]|uniref:Universal stress protein E n=1 Tax=Anatilimnocola aggregata TaxID=2528021 RepID=A0A517YFQ9_9BACT|nr:universal stress protein [Anatilimnocola aggregata]QDU29075.1 Universal stress protein E [Anatilimnocola aggregata]